eukprot:s4062_g10.t1
MAGRVAARAWRRRAAAGALRGRAVRYVAAAVLCWLAFWGCCMALLLPLCVFFALCAALGGPALFRAGAVPATARCWATAFLQDRLGWKCNWFCFSLPAIV